MIGCEIVFSQENDVTLRTRDRTRVEESVYRGSMYGIYWGVVRGGSLLLFQPQRVQKRQAKISSAATARRILRCNPFVFVPSLTVFACLSRVVQAMRVIMLACHVLFDLVLNFLRER